MADYAERKCAPCEGGVEPLTGDEARAALACVDGGWCLADDGKSIARRFEFPAYSRTMAFANTVAWLATVEGHHPVMTIAYGWLDVRFWTHAIGGLSDNDFICAAKIDRLAALD